MQDGVVAGTIEVVAIAEVPPLLAAAGEAAGGPFSAEELAYARAKRDPERRLAARLAAKRAAARLLGDGVLPRDVEVQRGRYGPPRMLLSERAQRRLAELGADRLLVSLTHGREHAAASVLLLSAR